MGVGLGNNWFSVGWPRGFSADCRSTNFQEIFAIFTAVTIWGSELCNKQILIYCDNETVVTVINSGTCKNNRIMDVVRGIFFVCAKNNIAYLLNTYRASKTKWLMLFLVCRKKGSLAYILQQEKLRHRSRALYGLFRCGSEAASGCSYCAVVFAYI